MSKCHRPLSSLFIYGPVILIQTPFIQNKGMAGFFNDITTVLRCNGAPPRLPHQRQPQSPAATGSNVPHSRLDMEGQLALRPRALEDKDRPLPRMKSTVSGRPRSLISWAMLPTSNLHNSNRLLSPTPMGLDSCRGKCQVLTAEDGMEAAGILWTRGGVKGSHKTLGSPCSAS